MSTTMSASLLPFRPQVRERVECGERFEDAVADIPVANDPHVLAYLTVGGDEWVQCCCGWTCRWFIARPMVCGHALNLELHLSECRASYARIVEPTLRASEREREHLREALGLPRTAGNEFGHD